jgi:hypothetical protein
MKVHILTIAIALYASVAMAQAPAIGSANSHENSRHFESGLGFSYDVPSELRIIDKKPFETAAKSLALQQATTVQEAKSINCSQQLLIAENGNESKIINFVASRQGCATGIVTEKNIDKLGQYGTSELAKRFAFVKPEFSQFKLGSHIFWVMKSAMTPNPPHNPNTEFALVITFTPEAVIECMIMARTPSDMAVLIATHVKFDDGIETELVPASTFTSK